MTPLEALEEIREYLYGDVYCAVERRLDLIETVLLDFEVISKENEELNSKYIALKLKEVKNKPKLKALEVIKEKGVSPVDIRCCNAVEQYNAKENGNTPLTPKEYDLLKEVLL